jgi:hypothetical protein
METEVNNKKLERRRTSVMKGNTPFNRKQTLMDDGSPDYMDYDPDEMDDYDPNDSELEGGEDVDIEIEEEDTQVKEIY